MGPHIPPELHTILSAGDHLIVSVSGGKDSDCQAIELARLRSQHGWTGRFIFIHADVGRMEWPSRCHITRVLPSAWARNS